MAGVLSAANFRFLYRETEGRIDRATWWTASLPLALLLFVLTMIWLAIRPPGARDLVTQGFFDAKTAVVYLYLILFAFTVLLVSVMQYSVSAKRLRDRGLPPSLAGLLPFAVFFTGGMHWLAPRSAGALPDWSLWALDVATLAVFFWTVIECGVKKGRR